MRRSTSLFIAFALAIAGCGGGGPVVVAVSGRVTLNDQPLRKASVQFLPIAAEGSIDAPGPGSTGVTDENGEFTLLIVGTKNAGAIVGEHRVIIQTAFSAARSDAPGTKEKLPAKYHANSELRFTVRRDGPNVADFALTNP